MPVRQKANNIGLEAAWRVTSLLWVNGFVASMCVLGIAILCDP